MKKKIRYFVLFPFSVLYGLVTFIRNKLYDLGALASYVPEIPVISVGNLTVGGTGKTPQVEYLIELLQDKYKVAVLSRGYKRKTKGFVLANGSSNSYALGDEPFQIYKKYKKIVVAVSEKRVVGVVELLKLQPEIEVIILDDAFQHRAINPGLKILLSDYSRLYSEDTMLPGGLLREYKGGSKRADIVVVTKCNEGLKISDFQHIESNLNILNHQQLFFSSIVYSEFTPLFPVDENQLVVKNVKNIQILLVTGIVSYLPVKEELERRGAVVEVCDFPDHHNFSLNNYTEIERKFIHLQSGNKMIVVTEKDAARILSSGNYPEKLRSFTFSLPISINFLQNKQSTFNNYILKYVESYTTNS